MFLATLGDFVQKDAWIEDRICTPPEPSCILGAERLSEDCTQQTIGKAS